MSNMLEINLQRPLTGNRITDRLRAYASDFRKVSLSISPFSEIIQWHKDPNLEGAEDYDGVVAVILRIHLKVPFPGVVNDFLPENLKRPEYVVSRFGLQLPKGYRELYLHTRIGTGPGTETYVHPNSVLSRRFYPPIERFMAYALED